MTHHQTLNHVQYVAFPFVYCLKFKKSELVMNNHKYSMSFTAGGLLHSESIIVAELYLRLSDWDTVKAKVIAENTLQSRAVSTLKRLSSEVISRLQKLTDEQIEQLVTSNSDEQAYILWLACCRRYQFVADFAVEVLRERFIMFKTELHYADFDIFFNRKCDWHDELENLTATTKQKVRQVLFKMLREVKLLDDKNTIQATIMSPELLAMLKRQNGSELMYFTVFEDAL